MPSIPDPIGPSLRGKISRAYASLALITVVLGVIAFLDLLFLERQVTLGEVASKLKDTVLEMRREEKNLFLYSAQEALQQAHRHAHLSYELLNRDRASLVAIAHDLQTDLLKRTLEDYRQRLTQWEQASSADRPSLEAEIRQLGHSITLATESLARQERRALQGAVRKSQWILLASFLAIGLSIYLVGHRLKQVVVSPLGQLESRLKPIAEGRFDRLDPPSNDREFITFTDAFNLMLRELGIRQRRMLQSEKLASLGTLAAGVAHELNNPLSNISSSCQLIMEELTEADPEQLDIWLRQIDTETERGRRIVRSLLDFGSQRVFRKQPLKLEELLRETQAIIGKMVREHGASLNLDIEAGLVLEVDKQRLQQFFINLIQNALQAGGHEIRISAGICQSGVSPIPEDAAVAGDVQCLTRHGECVAQILVADDGPGIAADSLSKVFDPFYTTSDTGQGTGLGLFIVQEIVREHGGCLAIASRPGRGTRVIVLLPIEEPKHV